MEQRVQALSAKRNELEAQKQQHVSSLEASNAAVSAIQQQLQEVRTKAVECASHIDQHESQSALKSRWIEELNAQAQQAQSEEAQLRARARQLDEQLAQVSGGEAEIRTQLAAVEAHAAQGGGEVEALEKTIQVSLDAINRAKANLFDAASEASHQRNQVAQSASQLQSLEAQLARLGEQRAQRSVHGEDGRRRREIAQGDRDALHAQSEESQRRSTAAQQAFDAAGARRHALTGRLHQLRDQVASARAHVKLLEDLWHRYEGFPETVKMLMGRSIEGLIGPLVDIVQAMPGYEEVVEAALGPLAEALVVRDRQALERCREFLTSQQLESCRFLVLSDCPAIPPMMERSGVPDGTSGAVKQYVRADPSYQPLVDWLLDDSWVIEDLARLLRERSVPERRLVSRRGERWDRRSWRFGGFRATVQSRLDRKQRWEQARSDLHSLEEEFARLEAAAQQAEQEWQSFLGGQESAKAQLAHMAPTLHKLDSQLTQLSHEAKRLDEEQRACELEIQELTAQREELRSSFASAQQAAEEAGERQQAIEQSLSDAQAAREAADRRTQQLMIARAQVEATRQSLTERLAALQERRQELTADQTQLLQQLEAKSRQRQEAIQRSHELAQQLEGHRQGVRQSQEERGRLEAEVERVSRLLLDEEAKRDQLLPHLLKVEQELFSLMQRMQEETQQLSERTFRRSRLVERLRELYQIDEATIHTEQQAHPAALTDEQRSTISEQVQKLRSKLEGMGPVSLGSVEEYDELKHRLEFLQTQQQDLLQARDDLKASISQINRTARSQFRETFERIKQEFQHYYTRLFSGGEADLILMDQDDVLESGIDIVARPPGKRLQSISLLSGGERALTAVALLFALFKVRPSPFCVLDEVDAPLDEANVDRFTRVLEEFLLLSQFILITHNKKTITKADSLYGVTMEEPGISKILSAKLTNAEAAPPATAVAV